VTRLVEGLDFFKIWHTAMGIELSKSKDDVSEDSTSKSDSNKPSKDENNNASSYSDDPSNNNNIIKASNRRNDPSSKTISSSTRRDEAFYQRAALVWQALQGTPTKMSVVKTMMITPGLWKHVNKPLSSTLVVDNFGVQYTNKDDADHLLTTLQKLYTVSVDWTGSKYCGMTLTWDYHLHTCNISMPGYIAHALKRFKHPKPTRPQHAPHEWQPPTYGA
jgi:hypothetical protein